MKLCYRGIPYEYNPTPVKVSGKKNTVQFRGCSYTKVVYRGISVYEGKSARFLGRSYERQEIVLVPASALI